MWNEDNYYRGASFGSVMPRMVKNIILVNIAVFLLQIASGGMLRFHLGLVSTRVIGHLNIWQFATYMFLHGNVFHIAINMFLLFMFGRELENLWGGDAFLKYYLTCGIGAGVITYFFTRGHPGTVTIGASGAVFGILVAYAVIYPDRIITLLVFFVLPVSLKAKHLVLILGAFEFLHVLAGTQDGIGHYAHLGGAVIGYIYLKVWKDLSYHGPDVKNLMRVWFVRPVGRLIKKR